MSEEIKATLDYAESRLTRALRLGRVEIKEPLHRVATAEARKPRDGSEKSYRFVQPEVVSEIVALWRSGKSVGEIRNAVHLEWSHIRYILSGAGIDLSKRDKPLTKRQRIEIQFRSGDTMEQIMSRNTSSKNYVRLIRSDMVASGELRTK